MMNMQTKFELERRGRRHEDEVVGRREDRRPGRLDGAARPAADRQPAGAARARRARPAGAGGGRRREGLTPVAVPFRIGVMQLTMEPLDEMLASARVDGRGGHGHDLARRGVSVVAQARHGGALVDRRLGADGARDEAADDRLGDHLAVHAPSGAGRDGRARRAGGGRPGRFILGFGTSKIFLNNAGMQTSKTLGPMRDAVEIVRGVLGGERVRVHGLDVERERAGAAGRGAHAARRAARLRRGDGAEDAGARRRDRRRLPDAVDHDAGVRPLHARERRSRHRHRLHGRRLDPRDRPRRGPRRRARDRRHVSREQGAEHPGLRRHAARPRGHRAGRDPPRRRGDGAGRPARGEGEGHRRAARQVQADRGHAGRLHRGDRGVPRRGLHARHARALGREPPRADPALRRAGAAALPAT